MYFSCEAVQVYHVLLLMLSVEYLRKTSKFLWEALSQVYPSFPPQMLRQNDDGLYTMRSYHWADNVMVWKKFFFMSYGLSARNIKLCKN